MLKKKKYKAILNIIVCFCLLLGITLKGLITVHADVAVHVSDDSKIPAGYTAVKTIADLYAIRNNPSGKYILMNDIDLSDATKSGGDYDCGTGWDSIETFSGVLDGNGYRIVGMHIFGSFLGGIYSGVGLFEQMENAVVKNLGLVNCDINIVSTNSSNYIGTITGKGKNSMIENCYSDGKIQVQIQTDRDYGTCIGGLIGDLEFSTIKNCSNLCAVSTNSKSASEDLRIGGILGKFIRGEMQCCYNRGIVACENQPITVGAIFAYGTGEYKNCCYLKNSAAQGRGDGNDNSDCKSLTEAQMKESQLFTGFDFGNVWEIDPYCSYPYPQLRNNPMIRVSSLMLTSEPSKLIYEEGDSLSLDGAVLKILYEDGVSTSIPLSYDMIKNFDMHQIGMQKINVSYRGKETSFTIEVWEVPISSITLPQTFSMIRSESAWLEPEILPENASNQEVIWKSSNENIVSVDGYGRIAAKSAGTAVITAETSNGLTASCTVTVLVPAVSIQLSQTTLTLKEGERKSITAQVLPLESTDTVKWRSGNPAVAEVYDGTIVAVTAGTASITAYTDSGVQASCTVTVQNNNGNSNGNAGTSGGSNIGNTGTSGTSNHVNRVGATYIKNKTKYKVTSDTNRTAEVAGINGKQKSYTVPSTIVINGITYRVTSIHANAFRSCKATKITLGANIQTIGKNAFYNCQNLKSLIIKSCQIKSVGKNAFKNVKQKVTIKVPRKKYKVYFKLFGKRGLK